MSRLIDADVAKSNLLYFITQNDTAIAYAIEHQDLTILENLIEEFWKEQKTAYDVDKVVEELEDKLYESSSGHAEAVMGMCGVSASGYSGEISAYGKAIEIVRKGGVNESQGNINDGK